ncbi:membrane protein insertion efficiency factor YidD [Photobacterium jeanii]|uniref:membrane protein insertion efficiency factor YidD n=1 Tax=Photobacterium jeanii TaxID=858640 RepID=UPI0009FF0EE9|nr:membrane protein insertion efficiency factor YidD [Photobacterium jeanii]PST92372.1 membrane protein insertion efficiency factor YidD [Photobacterium jeanii]
MVTRLVIRAIERYQRAGGSRHFFNLACNFEPTCSEYTRQAIIHYGLGKGVAMGWKRIRRCNNPHCTKAISDPLPLPHQQSK